MGHSINGIIVASSVRPERASAYRVPFLLLRQNLSLIPLTDSFCDYWAARLAIEAVDTAPTDGPLLDGPVARYIATDLLQSDSTVFSIIQTDYFGGRGEQAAAVYRGPELVFRSYRAPMGPINSALRYLGVKRGLMTDEFDTVGLGEHRHVDDLLLEFEDHRP